MHLATGIYLKKIIHLCDYKWNPILIKKSILQGKINGKYLYPPQMSLR